MKFSLIFICIIILSISACSTGKVPEEKAFIFPANIPMTEFIGRAENIFLESGFKINKFDSAAGFIEAERKAVIDGKTVRSVISFNFDEKNKVVKSYPKLFINYVGKDSVIVYDEENCPHQYDEIFCSVVVFFKMISFVPKYPNRP